MPISRKNVLRSDRLCVVLAAVALLGICLGLCRTMNAQSEAAGAHIYLFAVGTNGPNTGALSLINGSSASYDSSGNGYLVSNSEGQFTLRGQFSCPASNPQVYVAAVGGSIAGAPANPYLYEILALPVPCEQVNSLPAVKVNEPTTVAAAFALASFADTWDDGFSTDANSATALSAAFAYANALVNSHTGETVDNADYPLLQQDVDTLANILASCTASSSSAVCLQLMQASVGAGQPTPSDTLKAVLNIVLDPTNNLSGLFAFSSSPMSPATYQPSYSSAPSTWQLPPSNAPIISSVTSSSQGSGATVTVVGSNLVSTGDYPTIIVVGGVTATVQSATSTSITTTVPTDAVNGAVQVYIETYASNPVLFAPFPPSQTAALTVSLAPSVSTYETPVTVNVAVSAVSPPSTGPVITPTGTVQCTAPGVTIPPIVLLNGMGSTNVTGIAVGNSQPVSCTYSGDNTFFAIPTPIVANEQVLEPTVSGVETLPQGTRVYLFAVGLNGANSGATSLISGSNASYDGNGNGYLLTDSQGSFGLVGNYSCPASSDPPVYLVATSGVDGNGSPLNPYMRLVSALPVTCSRLGTMSAPKITSATTTAAAFALASFADIADEGLSTTPGSMQPLLSAFTYANVLASSYTGSPSYVYVSPSVQDDVDSVADMLAPCASAAGGACQQLMRYTTVPFHSAPTDTWRAALSVAEFPSNNVAALQGLIGTTPPYIPTYSAAPSSWQLPTSDLPVISSVSPRVATTGTSVTLAGSSFQAGDSIVIGGVSATATSATDTSVTATVPQGAVTGSAQVYSGNYGSNPVPFAVGTPIQSLTVTLSTTTSTFGQPVVVSVTVASGTNTVPTGIVTCSIPSASGTTGIAISLSNGAGTGTATGIPAGQQQPIACSYDGDNNFVASSAPTIVYETVNPGSSTPISVGISPNSSPYYFGQPLVLTATLPTAATGTVTFMDNGAALPAPSLVTVASGVATYTYKSPSLGAHSFIANYSGDASYMGVTSEALPVTVQLSPTTTQVTITPAASWSGYPVALNVTVTATGGTVVTAGGTISCTATSYSGTTVGQVSGQLSTTASLSELLLSGLPLASSSEPYSVICSFTSANTSEYANSDSSSAPALGTVAAPPSPTNSATGSLQTPRSGHQATLLTDGTVLVTGGTYGHVSTDSYPGSEEAFPALQTSEIYSDTGFAYAAQMTTARWGHTATLLSNGTGQVLITGGSNGSSAIASAEIFTPGSTPGAAGSFTPTALYDASTGTFSGATSQMNAARFFHTATLLQNGEVLLAGGQSSDGSILSSAELYNPATGQFSLTGPMTSPRWMHTATLLTNGTVLIAGGSNGSEPLATAEVYDPATNQFSAVGSMLTARTLAQSTLLGNGTVLITGGATCNSGSGGGSGYPDIRNTSCSTAEAEIYNAGQFSLTVDTTTQEQTSMETARYLHTATVLLDGTVLIEGGIQPGEGDTTAVEEIYNPTTGDFTSPGSLVAARWGHTSTLLLNGNVLAVGGENGISVGYGPVGSSDGGDASGPSAEIYGALYLNGGLYPKYMVLDIMYAPPGSGSSVTYTGQSVIGNTSSTTNSFTNGVTANAVFNIGNVSNGNSPTGGGGSSGGSGTGGGGAIGGASTGCSTSAGGGGSSGSGAGNGNGGITINGNGDSINGSYSYQLAESASYSLTTTTSTCTSVPGPSESSLGVDHESDIIWLWLNPATDYTVTPSNGPLVWNGYSTNSNDPNVQPGQMDIVPISIGQLDGTSPIPTALQQILERNWDPVSQGGAGGLTQADLLTILARDPFATNVSTNSRSTLPTNTPVVPMIPVFDPNIPTLDPVTGVCGGRYSFSATSGQIIPYSPLSVSNEQQPSTDIGQPATSLYSLNLTTQQSWSQTTSDSYSVGISAGLVGKTGQQNSGSTSGQNKQFAFPKILQSLKVSDSLRFVNSWNPSTTNNSSTIQTLVIKSPTASSGYNGPSEIQVWQDNIYGTFMFYPKPEDTNVVLQSSQSSVQFGQPLTLTASVLPGPNINNVPTGTVTFYDNCSVLGSGPIALVNGTATLPVTLSGGDDPPVIQTHTIRALYSGDGNFFHNVGNTLSQIATTTNMPYIAASGIAPSSGLIGASVTISGVNFGTSGTVSFNGVPAATSSWTSTSISATIPNGAVSGPVTVTVGSNVSNGVAFTITQPSGTATTTTLTLSPSTSWSGYPVIASAEVTTQTNAVPVGTVSCVSSPSNGQTNAVATVDSNGLAQVQLLDIPVLSSGSSQGVGYTETCTFTPSPGGSATFLGSQSNPVAGTVTPAPSAIVQSASNLDIPRENHQATLLNDGTLLITGGDSGKYAGEAEDSPNVDFLQSTEIYTGSSFVLATNMTTPRSLHQATLLSNSNGQVLITGGINGTIDAEGTPLASAELFTPGPVPGTPGSFAATTLYDPAAGAFTTTVTSMNTPRYWHTATLLPNGKVLIAGGTGTIGNFDPETSSYMVTAGPNGTSGNALATAELFDPQTGQFTYTSGPMTSARTRHTATLLQDGTVLIAGGMDANGNALSTAEIYNPSTDTFTPTSGPMQYGRIRAQATRLGDGTVLISGGSVGAETNSDCPSFRTTSGCARSDAEIYNPATKTFRATNGPMSVGRYSHSATVLYDGTVLISGGITNWYCVGSDCNEDTAPTEEIYTPSTGLFSTVTNLVGPRFNHTATLLPSTGVLLVGGAGGDVFGATPLGYTTNTYASVETYSPPVQTAAVHPKFMVLNVAYAPPGSGSTVTYTNSTEQGSSTVTTQTKSNALTLSLGGTFQIGKVGASITANAGYTFSQNSSTTYGLNTTTTDSITVAGPSQSGLGVDHEADIIWVWLNPETDMTLTSPPTPTTAATAVWTGFALNPGDTNVGTGEMDVIPLTVSQLDGTSPIPDDVQEVLARNWDPVAAGGAGGLTQSDLATILKRDPFAVNFTWGMPSTAATNTPQNAAYPISLYPVVDPNVPTHDPNNPVTTQCGPRYQQVNSQPIQFATLGETNQANSQTYSLQSNLSQGSATNTSDTYDVGLSVGLCIGLQGKYCDSNPNNPDNNPTNSSTSKQHTANAYINFSIGDTYSWGINGSKTSNDQTLATSALTIKNPLPSDNYAGPVQMQVWRDNLFGTYMFYPKPTDTSVSLSSSSSTTEIGNDVTFTAAVTPSNTASGSPVLPTGTVTFYDGCNAVGSPQGLSNGAASITTSWAEGSEGSHTIVAVYSGDTTYFHNDAPALTETVGSTNSSLPYIPAGGLSPASGPVGTTVTITGQNFGSSGSVRFNGIVASTSSWSSTSIIATVPVGATSGPVVVAANGESSNSLPFQVVVPNSTTITTLTLAPTISWSGSQVTARVSVVGPAGSTMQGTVACSVNGGTSTSPITINPSSASANVPLTGVPTIASGQSGPITYSASCTFTSSDPSYSGSQSNLATGTVTNEPAATNQGTPGSLNVGREGHQATALTDGTVLITGGSNLSGAISSSEIYSNGFFTLAAPMSTARSGHQATLLGNSTGQVLVTGGTDANGNVLSTAEIFTPGPAPGNPGSFASTTLIDSSNQMSTATVTTLNAARTGHSATLLNNGKVLIVGGINGSGEPINSAELYDPVAGSFSFTAGSMAYARYGHAAAVLPDGTVLISGGIGSSGTALNTAEIYNPVTDSFSLTQGPMLTARSGAQATSIVSMTTANGTPSTIPLVLITGGQDSSGTTLNSAELYNVATGTFSQTQDANGPTTMNAARSNHTATLLSDGTALITGGLSGGTALQSEEVYNPATGDFSLIASSLVSPRANHTATVLPGGDVLLVGGENVQNSTQTILSSAETFSAAFAQGALLPKYMVLDVLYAPPGSGSTMTYANQSVMGTTTSTSSSFSHSQTASASVNIGVADVTLSPGIQWGHTFTQGGASSYAFSTTTNDTIVVPGPVAAGTQKSPVSTGVDHESDIIQLWLNPATVYTATSLDADAPLVWNGFAANSNDPNVAKGAMDVVSLTVSQLDGTSPIPPELMAALERSWDPVDAGGAGGLTPADFQTVLQRDPFATNLSLNGQPSVSDNASSYFDPNIPVADPQADGVCSTRYGFNPSASTVFSFGQLGTTNKPETVTYALQNSNTQTTGNTTTDQYSVTNSNVLSIDLTTQVVNLGFKLSDSNTFTWSNTASLVTTAGTAATQTLTIKNPLIADNYTKPTQMQVWIDKIYGTYMFYPRPSDTTVTLLSSQNSAGNGDTVIVTAMVAADPKLASTTNPPLTPTGTVSFYDGCTLLGIQNLNSANGQASLSISSLADGNHSILAAYSGDSNFHHNSSSSIQLTWASSSPSTPFVNSIAPSFASVGDTVTITGANFGTTGSVSFNGIVANTTSWSSSSIVATVPAGATTGPVAVTSGGVTGSGFQFTVPQASGMTSTSVKLSPSTTWSGFPISANVTVTGSETSIPTGTVSCTVASSAPGSGTATGSVALDGTGTANVPITTSIGLPAVGLGGSPTLFTVSCNFTGTNGYANSQSSAISATAVAPPVATEASAGNLDVARENQQASLLEDGTVLLTGGDNGSSPLSSAEIYANGSFAATASMTSARVFHQQTVLSLSTGQVLITGGTDGVSNALSSAELYTPASLSGVPATFQSTTQYDPEAKVFTSNRTSMTTARVMHTATQLKTGEVLIVGGTDNSGSVLASAELYDPLTGLFTETKGSLNVARSGQAATLLLDGTVLITGGFDQYGNALSSAEIYSPVTDSFTLTTGPMTAARAGSQATLLGSGLVLITGGQLSSNTAEIYDPSTGLFAVTRSVAGGTQSYMVALRSRHSAVLLYDNTVLISGGEDATNDTLSSQEVYDPTTGTFTAVATNMQAPRHNQSATLLPTQGVLIAGGENTTANGSTVQGSADLYSPSVLSAGLHPKYMVVNIQYAPPGSGSSLIYTDTSTIGSSTGTENSFTHEQSLNYTVGVKFGIGVLSFNLQDSTSQNWIDTQDNTSTHAISTVTTDTNSVPGPTSSGLGVDHESDTIWIWLNPVVDYTVTSSGGSNNIVWNGFDIDSDDTNVSPGQMDIIPLSVSQLDGSAPISEDEWEILDRNWDPVSSGGAGPLTSADLLNILGRDPFATQRSGEGRSTAPTTSPALAVSFPLFDPNVPTLDPTTQACGTRYDFTPGLSLTFPYSQLGSDNQALTQTYLLASNVANSHSSTTTDTYQVAISGKISVPSEIANLTPQMILANQLGAKVIEHSLTAGEELAWTNRWTTVKNNATLHTQALTIVDPVSSDNYTGPQQVQVWKDNLYGTFMFYPKPSDTSWILTSNQSAISAGSIVTLSATVTPDPSIPYAPTGTVTFYDGCTDLGSASINPATGTATLSTSSITASGSNTIEAIYSGDINFYHNNAVPITITVSQ